LTKKGLISLRALSAHKAKQRVKRRKKMPTPEAKEREKTLAIILANYNDSRWLINWFEKISMCRVPDEMIVVDDCSTDRSVELLTLLKEKYPSLNLKIVINKKRLGPCGSVMEALKVAKSEYVGLSACDDEIKPDYIQRMKKAINDFPLVDLYLCNAIVEREGREYKKAYYPFDVFLSPDYLVELYKNNNPSMINIVGLVVKKTVLLQCWEDGGKDLPTCFDGMFLFFAAFSKGMIVLGDCLVKYRASLRGWGATGGYIRNRVSEKKIMEIWKRYPHIWKRAEESRIWSNKTSSLASLGLWIIPKLPEWIRRIVYKKYYGKNMSNSTCYRYHRVSRGQDLR